MSDTDSAAPRLSTRAFLQDVADELFSLDRGVAYTLWQLLRRPGTTIRRYIEQRDARLTKPFRLVVISIAVFALFSTIGDWGGSFLVGFAQGANGSTDGGISANYSAEWLRAHLDWLFVACWVPAVGAAVQSVYRSRGLNSAESFVFGLYTLPPLLVWLLLGVATGLFGWMPSVTLLLATFLPLTAAAHGYFRPVRESLLRAALCALVAGFMLVIMLVCLTLGSAVVGYLGG